MHFATGPFPAVELHIHRRIHIVYIFLIQLFPELLHTFAEALEVNDFPLTPEFDHIVHIGVVAEAQDIIVGGPGFLLWYDYKCTTDPENP